MTAPAPVAVRWDGDAFVPISQRFARQAGKDFVIGEVYHMVTEEPRSAKSHRHYLAAVTEAWRSLPESMDGRFPTADHLRAFALCMTGYRDERHIVCASRAEALRVAAFIRPMNEFAIGSVEGPCVTVGQRPEHREHRPVLQRDSRRLAPRRSRRGRLVPLGWGATLHPRGPVPVRRRQPAGDPPHH